MVWRLRRVPAFEVALFNWMMHVQVKENDNLRHSHKSRSLLAEPFMEADDDSSATQEDLEVGRAFEALLTSDLMSKLSRYETTLQRELSSTLAELRQLNAARPVLPKLIDATEEAQRPD